MDKFVGGENMFCRNCGKEVVGNAEFCDTCMQAFLAVSNAQNQQTSTENNTAENVVKETITCPYCGKETDKEERFCEHCDAFIQPDKKPTKRVNKETTATTNAERTKTCKFCYARIPENKTYCPKCNRLANVSAINSYMKPTSGSYWYGFWLTFFLGWLGLLIAWGRKEDETMKGAKSGFIWSLVVALVVVIICVSVILNLSAEYY